MLRFAPSLTGDMNINSMRIALINYIISRKKNEQFIVRIEDIDKEKNIEGIDQETLDIMKKFSIEQDQLFYQSDNLGRYQQFALSLLGQKKAFACICTTEEFQYKCNGNCMINLEDISKRIKDENLPYVIRINIPKEPIEFIDIIKGRIITQPNDIDSFVILEANGNPTYDFAASCDDMLSDISTVIRSEEYLENTPRQIHIKSSLGYKAETKYAHLSSISNRSDKKTSFKDDTYSIKWMIKKGFLPDAIINYLLLLGNEVPYEIFTLPEAIEWFDLTVMSKNPVRFDIEKLRSINREHLEIMDDKLLSKIFNFADADIGKLLKIYLQECSTINELDCKIKAIFTKKEASGELAEEISMISDIIISAPAFNSFTDFKSYILDKSGLDSKRLFKPLRMLMTGAQNGPELSEIYPLIRPYITEIVRCY